MKINKVLIFAFGCLLLSTGAERAFAYVVYYQPVGNTGYSDGITVRDVDGGGDPFSKRLFAHIDHPGGKAVCPGDKPGCNHKKGMTISARGGCITCKYPVQTIVCKPPVLPHGYIVIKGGPKAEAPLTCTVYQPHSK